jgi:hypothetical protein
LNGHFDFKDDSRLRPAMNHSMHSADQMTHLKIVIIALVAGIGVAGFGIATQIRADDGHLQTARALKANAPLQDRQFAFAQPAL